MSMNKRQKMIKLKNRAVARFSVDINKLFLKLSTEIVDKAI
jgi:hypothetical protein